ncbi:MAG: glycosyltransferase [Patescibacteria group bacterium]|nr:glycosyltransferase [Patescibacteria group bacterium]MCL5261684.1 glycosyltransferase [Patescibacteria group bacterium]
MLDTIAQITGYFAEFFALFMGIFYLLTFIENKDRIEAPAETEPKNPSYPSVTVVIPAYNEEKNIAATIASAANLDYPAEKLKILVVDDGSKDKTLEAGRAEAAKHPERNIKVVANPHGGKARTMNAAIAMINSEFMVTLDADSYVTPDALKRMIPYFSKNERVAAVVAAMKIRDPKTFLQKIQSAEYLLCFYIKKMMSLANGLLVTPGPFSAYRMSVFEKIGGFEEGNLTEDGEIALRLQKHQYSIEYCHNAEVFTNAPATLKALKNQRVRWNRGTLRNFFKYRKLLGDPRYGDFGLFIFPSAIFFLIIAFDLFLISVAHFAIAAAKKIEYGTLFHLPRLSLEGGLHISNFFIQPTAMQLISIVIFSLSLISFYFIYKYSPKDLKGMTLFYIPYILIYYPLFVIGFWMITLFYELTHQKLYWYK